MRHSHSDRMSRRVHTPTYATPAGNLSRLQLVLRAGLARTGAPAPSKPANPETPEDRSLKDLAKEEILLRRVVAAFKDSPPKPKGRADLHPSCLACEKKGEGKGEKDKEGGDDEGDGGGDSELDDEKPSCH